MMADENDMLKLDNFDLVRPDVISTNVDFVTNSADEEVKLEMEFSKPKLKQQVKIHHVEHTTRGASGAGLF